MNINMTSILVIVFAIITIILNIKSINKIKNIGKSRRISMLVVRLLLILLITIGTIGVSLNSKSDMVHTVFIVDRSSSILEEKENIELFVNDAIKRKRQNDVVSIVSFGANVATEYTSFTNTQDIKLDSIINSNATNYEEAIKRANEMILKSESGRLVFISDGLENQNDYSKVIQEIKDRNIEFKFVKINAKHGLDSQISDIKVPKDVTVGESFQINLEIYSSKSSNAILRIYKGSEIFSEKEIKISKGVNHFTYKDVLSKSGNQLYSAEIDMMGDYYSKNNKFATMTNGIGSPRLLLVGDGKSSEEYIEKLALDNGFKVDNYKSDEIPVQLKNLLKYQAIILNNVTLEETPSQFSETLNTYVEDFGGGLFVTGGDSSYALGGYYKTKLEEMLPINMEMKRDGMLPSVSIVIIIDRSGSMSGNKMEMAKEAARKSVEAMKPNDSMAVLAFDDTRTWVSRLKSAEEKDYIVDSIGSIKAAGGTSILPALKEGIKELEGSDSKLKHIILLTDGQAETSGYESVIDDAVNNEITISTIAVGSASDVRLLDYIAKSGKGRFYNVVKASNIPNIFTKETFLASKSYINEEDFTPIITSDSALVRPLYNEIYDVSGYVSTSLKNNSELILKTDKDEPLLASWNYGLGKVSAWTSDAGKLWSNRLFSSDSGKLMFLNIINDVLINNSTEDINISSSQKGSNVNIILGKEELSTAIISDQIILIDELGREKIFKGNIYNNQFVKATINNIEEGLYIVKSSAVLDGKKIYKTSPLLINYSSEYDMTSSEDVSDDLVKKLDALFIEESSQVFTDMKSKVYEKKDFSDLFLILAIIVFILDIYIRRFRNDKLRSFFGKISTKINVNIKKLEESKQVKSVEVANSEKIFEESKSFKENERVASGDMDHLSRLIKAKEKRK